MPCDRVTSKYHSGTAAFMDEVATSKDGVNKNWSYLRKPIGGLSRGVEGEGDKVIIGFVEDSS